MAAQLGERMAATLQSLVSTAGGEPPSFPGTIAAYGIDPAFSDFATMTVFRPLPASVSSSAQGQIYIYNAGVDPAFEGAKAKLDEATQQANDALARRKKAMEDAARAAAEAFDMEQTDTTAPVQLDAERRLKVVS